MFDLEPLMKRIGMSAARLAKLAGVHRNTLGYAVTESDRNRRRISPDTLRKVASGLEKYAAELTTEAQKLRAEADSAPPPPRTTRR